MTRPRKPASPSPAGPGMTAAVRSRSKYRNVRTLYNGVPYPSKAEAGRAADLDLMVKAGAIRGWVRQVTVCLGLPENAYRVDFLVFGADGIAWAEDVKGKRTRAFERNVKLWRRYGPCPLHVISGRKLEIIDPFTPEPRKDG